MPLGIFVAFVLAHLSVRKFAPGADPAILPLAFALSGIGIAFITRLAPDLAMRQVMWLFLGVVCMVVVLALLRNVDRLANYKYTLMIAGFEMCIRDRRRSARCRTKPENSRTERRAHAEPALCPLAFPHPSRMPLRGRPATESPTRRATENPYPMVSDVYKRQALHYQGLSASEKRRE